MVTIRQARVVPVRLGIQELFVDQRVKDHLAHRLLDAAQTLHLFGSQPQSGHFQILGSEMVDDIFNRPHDGTPSTKRVTLEAEPRTLRLVW
jgi:hypothetical protein